MDFTSALCRLGAQWRVHLATELSTTCDPDHHNGDDLNRACHQPLLATAVAATAAADKAVLWEFFALAVRRSRSSNSNNDDNGNGNGSDSGSDNLSRLSPAAFRPQELVGGCVVALEVACAASSAAAAAGTSAAAIATLPADSVVAAPPPVATPPQGDGREALSARARTARLLADSLVTTWLLAHEEAYGDVEAEVEAIAAAAGDKGAAAEQHEPDDVWESFITELSARHTAPTLFVLCVLTSVPMPAALLRGLEQLAERQRATNALREDMRNRLTQSGGSAGFGKITEPTHSQLTSTRSAGPAATSVTASPSLASRSSVPLNDMVGLRGLETTGDDFADLNSDNQFPLVVGSAGAPLSPGGFSLLDHHRVQSHDLKLTSQSYVDRPGELSRALSEMSNAARDGWLEKSCGGSSPLPKLQFRRVWASLERDGNGVPTFFWFTDKPLTGDSQQAFNPKGWVPLDVLTSVQIGCERERIESRVRRRSSSAAAAATSREREISTKSASSDQGMVVSSFDDETNGSTTSSKNLSLAETRSPKDPGFTLRAGGHSFMFRCTSDEEARSWVFAFQCHSAARRFSNDLDLDDDEQQQRRFRILHTAQWWKKYEELATQERALSSSAEERVWRSRVRSVVDRAGTANTARWHDHPAAYSCVARAWTQGHRSQMEDADDVGTFSFSVDDESSVRDVPELFVGIYDGHGGSEASRYVASNLRAAVADQLAACHFGSGDDMLWASLSRQAKVRQAIVTAHRQVDRRLLAESASRDIYDGSTSCSAIISPATIAVANVGDSRAVLCRRRCKCEECSTSDVGERFVAEDLDLRASSLRTSNGGFSDIIVEPLSRDHRPPHDRPDADADDHSTPECLDERARILRAGGWFSDREELDWAGVYRANPAIIDVLEEDDALPDHASFTRRVIVTRLLGELSVTRAFGDIEYKLPHCNEYWDPSEGSPFSADLVSADPDVVFTSTHGSGQIDSACSNRSVEFLIIACDGLWDVIHSSDACKFVHVASAWQKPEDIARALVELALQSGSMDNISVAIVFFKPLRSETAENTDLLDELDRFSSSDDEDAVSKPGVGNF